jgi:hypothetical protein
MSEWQPTEEEVAAVVQVLIDEGGDSDEGLHLSWRCFDKDRYPEPCRCLHAVAGIILAAVGPAIHETGYNQGGQKGMEEGYAIGYQEGVRDALREAAEAWEASLNPPSVRAWLRARAEGIGK